MPGYRPPSTEPRGKWAKAIHAKRRAEGLSQTGAFEVLGARLGLGPKSRAAYVAIDIGTRDPDPDEAEVLAEWLGRYPEDEPIGDGNEAGPPAIAALIEHLQKQTDAIDRLAESLLSRSPEPAPIRVPTLPTATADSRRLHWIAQARERLGSRKRPMPTAEIAAAMGLTGNAVKLVADWASGRQPVDPAYFERLANALHIPLRDMIDPPETDQERLDRWAREFSEIEQPETEERQRRAS